MKRLSKELIDISTTLEEYWILRMSTLVSEGKSSGNPEYDAAFANLCAIVNEFWI